MKPFYLIAAAGFTTAALACDQRPLAGPEVPPIVLGAVPADQAAPLIFVDGRRVASSSLRRLDASVIRAVEVIKGPMALRLYGEEGHRGVILIQTK